MSDTLVIQVPDIGDFDAVDVAEVFVKVGDHVAADALLIALESDKATMEIPTTHAGTVVELLVKAGDQVKKGSGILRLQPDAAAAEAPKVEAPKAEAPKAEAPKAEAPKAEPPRVEAPRAEPPKAAPPPSARDDDAGPRARAHAGPAVRRFARELGADLSQVKGTGRKGRIQRADVEKWVKARLTAASSGEAGAGIPKIPEIDFAQFGEIERQPLTKINKLTARNLHRAWLNVPMVTQFDEADITELDAFRRQLGPEADKRGVKLTFVAFLVKAVATALVDFPRFNASLDPSGEQLVLKKYVHVGVAVDTPKGLVVPVIRDADRKGLFALAAELGELSGAARAGKLTPAQMQGASFTISSLGGIGGTKFTPIVNAPEVAILGVSKAKMQPVWDGAAFQPRLMLPLCLTYDHRVIDGADGARFTSHLGALLADLRRALL